MELKFKKNESFYIRDGWFEKAVNSLHDLQRNIFFKDDGIEILGIGSNMVKSLKYWLQAANIISPRSLTNDLTEFGQLLFRYDKYLDSPFSWFLIHFYLVQNKIDCPIFHYIFSSEMKSFSKNDGIEYIEESIKKFGDTPNRKYIEEDFNVFLKSYTNENRTLNPEENYVCPLASLKLLTIDKGRVSKAVPQHSKLSYLLVFYVLLNAFPGQSFNIDDSIDSSDGPTKIFCLDKTAYLQYLDEIRHEGLITINKTAGINTVYYEKKLSLQDIFEAHFERQVDYV